MLNVVLLTQYIETLLVCEEIRTCMIAGQTFDMCENSHFICLIYRKACVCVLLFIYLFIFKNWGSF